MPPLLLLSPCNHPQLLQSRQRNLLLARNTRVPELNVFHVVTPAHSVYFVSIILAECILSQLMDLCEQRSRNRPIMSGNQFKISGIMFVSFLPFLDAFKKQNSRAVFKGLPELGLSQDFARA